MNSYLVLFREPDGRTEVHSDEDIARHSQNWKAWGEKWSAKGKLSGGSGLTLNGKIVKGEKRDVIDDIHKSGTEIVGGFLLINAKDMEEATSIVADCPVFEFDGYAEIREIQR